uniref:Uncharacterized protein n=1 Tax=Arundo donax TaxID=35708 RepID=A0A0A9BQS4_ARUDO
MMITLVGTCLHCCNAQDIWQDSANPRFILPQKRK